MEAERGQGFSFDDFALHTLLRGIMPVSEPNSETEKKFEDHRNKLRHEATCLASYIALYRNLHERRTDRLAEMNLAPAFFQTVIMALNSALILWVSKLFDKNGQRGIFNFLSFIENNLGIFSIEQLQRRRNYPAGHRLLDQEPITVETINEYKRLIESLECLPSFRTRRDKFYAHFDKEYFFDPDRLAEEAPLTRDDLEEVVRILSEIIDHYSCAYDGEMSY